MHASARFPTPSARAGAHAAAKMRIRLARYRGNARRRARWTRCPTRSSRRCAPRFPRRARCRCCACSRAALRPHRARVSGRRLSRSSRSRHAAEPPDAPAPRAGSRRTFRIRAACVCSTRCVEWDAQRIRCRSGTHRAPDHPLRAHGRLGAACGIEYRRASHGGARLRSWRSGSDARALRRRPPRQLARRTAARCCGSMMCKPELICDAVRVAGDGGTALYEFELRAKRVAC